MIPHFIWKLAERGLVKEFDTSEANSLSIASDKERLKEVLDRFVSYFTLVMRQNTLYFAKFVLCEILNVVVLAFNFYVTNAFFSYKWGRYGFEGWIRLCGIFCNKIWNNFMIFMPKLY